MGITVEAILAELGSSVAEVAARLQAKGIRGVRNAVRFLNPIVRYVQYRLRVDAFGLDVMTGDMIRLHHAEGRKEETPLPLAVRAFLDAFNAGQFPRLEMTQEV
jgi:hypothetical protein